MAETDVTEISEAKLVEETAKQLLVETTDPKSKEKRHSTNLIESVLSAIDDNGKEEEKEEEAQSMEISIEDTAKQLLEETSDPQSKAKRNSLNLIESMLTVIDDEEDATQAPVNNSVENGVDIVAIPDNSVVTDAPVENSPGDVASKGSRETFPDASAVTNAPVNNSEENVPGNDTEKAFSLLAALYALAGGWSEPKVPAGAPLSGTK